MGKADLHIHTTAGDGLLDPCEVAEYVATQTDLDVIAIADHDTLDGAWKAWHWLQAHPGSQLGLLWGVEITAAWFRHLLCYWPYRPPRRLPRRFLSPARVIAELRDSGGIVVAAHPTNPFSLGGRDLAALAEQDLAPDALEACSPVLGRRREARLRALAHRHGMGVVGGSDAHGLLQVIGAAYTCFPGHTAHDLARALSEHTTDARWHDVPVHTPLAVLARQFIRAWVSKPGLLQRTQLTAIGLIGDQASEASQPLDA